MGMATEGTLTESYESLHAACEGNALVTVQALVENGADVNSTDSRGMPVLLHAADHGGLEVVQWLVEHGADVHAVDRDGRSALTMAVGKGDLQTAKYLVDKGADIHALDNRGRPLLRYAAWDGNMETIEWLVDNGPHVNAADKNGYTVVHRMAVKEGAATMAYFLDKGADINAIEKNGKTGLHCAVERDNMEMAECLIERGADLNLADNSGHTALHYAVDRELTEMVALLIRSGADVNAVDKNGSSVLHNAGWTGNFDLVVMLVESGANIHAIKENGSSMLHIAAWWGNVDMATFLIDRGLAINTDRDGKSPLIVAIEVQNDEMVETLVTRGADVNLTDKNQKSPLHYAVAQGSANIVSFLLDKGADVAAVTLKRMSVLHWATAHGKLDIVTMLVENGANVNAATIYGNSVLHNAVGQGKIDMVKYLVEHGANVKAVDRNGRGTLHYVAENMEAERVSTASDSHSKSSKVNAVVQSVEDDASKTDRVALMEYLVRHGADVNATDENGVSVLHAMVIKGVAAMVKYLIDEKANVNAIDKNNRTVLLYAAERANELVLSLLLSAGANVNAIDTLGKSVLRCSIEGRRFRIAEFLLENGADVNAVDSSSHTLVYDAVHVLFSQCREAYSAAKMLCSHGAVWIPPPPTVGHSETKKSRKVVVWRSGLQIAVLHWIAQRQRTPDPTLADIPIEEVARGEESVRTYLAELFQTSDDKLRYRRKVCVVGPSEWGKTSLVTSLTTETPSLVHIDDRTIGIDLFSCSFDKAVGDNQVEHHEVTFWDFAGQDVYQVTHALFFSQRTLYLLCVNLEAYANELKRVESLSLKKAEVAMKRFVTRHVLRWIRLIFTRQPDAQFVVVGTKADRLSNKVKQTALIWQDLKARLFTWKRDLMQEIDEASQAAATSDVSSTPRFFSALGDDRLVQLRELKSKVSEIMPTEWIVVSSMDISAVKEARQALEIVIAVGDRSFKMPEKYSRVLEFIQRQRLLAVHFTKPKDRIENMIVPFQALYTAIAREIDDLEYDDCVRIIQSLHDIGDVLWYEKEGSGYFKNVVILDPTLVLDFVREAVNHQMSDEAKTTEATLNTEGRLAHDVLSQIRFWRDSDQELTHAFKMLLQHYQLAYPADSKQMDWDSDLIVPAYWKNRKVEKSSPLGDSTSTLQSAVVCWEYELAAEVSETVFDHFAVQSYSPLIPRTMWRNCIESSVPGEFNVRVEVFEDDTTRATIRVEVAAETAEIGWHYMRFFVMAMEKVLEDYPGLTPSRYIEDGGDQKTRHRLNDAVGALTDSLALGKSIEGLRSLMPWMPPDLSWFMEKAWNDPGKLQEIQLRRDVHQLVSKTDVLKKLIVAGGTKRRLPALWTLDYREDEKLVRLCMLSDLSGDCFHVPIEIPVPPLFLSKHGSWFKTGLAICSTVIPQMISLGVVNKAIDCAVLALSNQVERAQCVYSLIDSIDLQTSSGFSSTGNAVLSPRATMALLRDLLQLYDSNFDELRICELSKLECAVTADGSYVWASRQEIMGLADQLTPCDAEDSSFKNLVDPSIATSPQSTRSNSTATLEDKSQRSLSAKSSSSPLKTVSGSLKLRLKICGTTDLPAWDWRRAYCKWQLIHPKANKPLASDRTGQHTDDTHEPSWESLEFAVANVDSLETLRECRLHVELRRPSRWLGMVKLIAQGSVRVGDFEPENVNQETWSLKISLDEASPMRRVLRCELSIHSQ